MPEVVIDIQTGPVLHVLTECLIRSVTLSALISARGLVTRSSPFAKPPHHGCAVPDISDVLAAVTRPTRFRRPF
jgi:hypothetical protein